MSTETKDIRIKIVMDQNPINPREDDNLGILACFHKRYQLGDDNIPFKSSDFDSWDDMENYIARHEKGILIQDIYMLDHGGLYLRINRDFGDVDPGFWDSGKIGFLYTTKEKIREYFGVKRVTKRTLKKAERVLFNEFYEYKAYIEGEVYGWILEEKVTCPTCGHVEYDVIDSMFGYYRTKDILLRGQPDPLFMQMLNDIKALHPDLPKELYNIDNWIFEWQ